MGFRILQAWLLVQTSAKLRIENALLNLVLCRFMIFSISQALTS